MALDHAPMLTSSWYHHGSRYDSTKRASDVSVPHSLRAKRRKVGYASNPMESLPHFNLSKRNTITEDADRKTEEWFKTVNNDVPVIYDSDLVDSEPFYLQQHAPSEPDELVIERPYPSLGGPNDFQESTLPLGMLGHETCGCSEAYRSVIDDLTIENTQLKQTLQKYDRLQCPHLQHEKLFEVKIHGLPAHRRRDLERVLREFAAGLEERTALKDASYCQQYSLQQDLQADRPPNPHPTPVDSAYASTSASEPTLSFHSKSHSALLGTQTPSLRTNNLNSNSKVSETPYCLMPSRSPNVSLDAKKKIVVKRLEQLFTGKSAATVHSDLSRQQPGVPYSATTGEKRTAEAISTKTALEGAREARILANDSECLLEHATDHYLYPHGESGNRPRSDRHSSEDNSPQQRPTRPMDLDMHQAHDGADNVKYIQHLGLGLPIQRPGISDTGDGWVYLNLLMSMAQLHTLNVTPDFVRKAVTDVSSRFELSSDGQQVRWRGGVNEGTENLGSEITQVTAMDHDIATNHIISPEKPTVSITKPSKTPVSAHTRASSDLQHKHPPISGSSPVDHHESDLGTSSESVDGTTDYVRNPDGARSCCTAEASLNAKPKSGSIIFYTNARFCTDLSADACHGPCNDVQYSRFTERPLGSAFDLFAYTENTAEKRSTLSHFADSVSDSRSTFQSEIDLDFPNMDALSLGSHRPISPPVELEASGLSGIQPGDNFMVDVHVQHVHDLAAEQTPSSRRRIISTIKTNLEPSQLPPPSYICLPFSPSESDASDSDADSEKSDTSSIAQHDSWHNDGEMLPSGYIPSLDQSQGRRIHGSEESSINLLSHGRSFDPRTFTSQRKYRGIGFRRSETIHSEKYGDNGSLSKGRTRSTGHSPAGSMSVDANWSSNDHDSDD